MRPPHRRVTRSQLDALPWRRCYCRRCQVRRNRWELAGAFAFGLVFWSVLLGLALEMVLP